MTVAGSALAPRDRDIRSGFGLCTEPTDPSPGSSKDLAMSQNVTLGTKSRRRSIRKANSIAPRLGHGPVAMVQNQSTNAGGQGERADRGPSRQISGPVTKDDA